MSIYPSPIWQLHYKSMYASLCARMGPTQSSLRQAADLAYPSTNHPCSDYNIFGNFPILRGSLVQNGGAPEIGDVPNGTVYIWKYPCSMMFQRYVNDLQSNYHQRARNRVEREAFASRLLIGIIPFRCCAVHTYC